MAKKILLGLTTITPGGEWKNKVQEIDKLGIREIALFTTCLNLGERKELYQLLENTKLECIPHVHIREEDTEDWELDYFVDRYKTQVFNAHPIKNFASFFRKHQKHKNNIYIENVVTLDDNFEDTVKNCGGICLDLSHWESHGVREKKKGYERLADLLNRYKVGVNHLSAIKSEKTEVCDPLSGKKVLRYDSHWLGDLSEVDYVKRHGDYLADIISLELENSLKRQMEVKKYLEKILDL